MSYKSRNNWAMNFGRAKCDKCKNKNKKCKNCQCWNKFEEKK